MSHAVTSTHRSRVPAGICLTPLISAATSLSSHGRGPLFEAGAAAGAGDAAAVSAALALVSAAGLASAAAGLAGSTVLAGAAAGAAFAPLPGVASRALAGACAYQ